jgi:hypothetical protein
MEEKKYTKLSELVNDQFTVVKAWGFSWKKWDDVNRKMLMSDSYVEGYRKIYSVDTDKGKLDLGSGQFANLLEAVAKNGVADINGRTFKVKSNGKSGMDIRYFLNATQDAPVKEEAPAPTDSDDEINLDDIPF